MARSKILKNPDVHSKSENLLHNQSKKPLRISITREDFYLVQRTEIQLAGLYDLTNEIEAYHSILFSLLLPRVTRPENQRRLCRLCSAYF